MKLVLKNVTKRYNDKNVVNDVCLVVENGEFVTILGPSGAGKSTILNMIAGIVKPDFGSVQFDEDDVTSHSVYERNIGFVFQDYALYPNMNVYKNISFPLENMLIPKKDIEKKVNEMASLAKISHLLKKKPSQLSGGEKQRVAIAKALVKKPKIILFDEPFSSLDQRLSYELRDEILELLHCTNTTAIMVTHNQSDAMYMSDRIAIVNEGILQQYGTPMDIYISPKNYFCANFIGESPINKIYGRINSGNFIFNNSTLTVSNCTDIQKSLDVVLCIRPKDLIVATTEIQGAFPAKIMSVHPNGRDNTLRLKIGNIFIEAFVPSEYDYLRGEMVWVNFPHDKIFIFDIESGERV